MESIMGTRSSGEELSRTFGVLGKRASQRRAVSLRYLRHPGTENPVLFWRMSCFMVCNRWYRATTSRSPTADPLDTGVVLTDLIFHCCFCSSSDMAWTSARGTLSPLCLLFLPGCLDVLFTERSESSFWLRPLC